MDAGFLGLAVTSGAAALLTPCVFPMIPITVSYFLRHTESGRREVLLNAGVFGLGMILTFTALGLGLAILVGATGMNRFVASPWVNLLFAAIFLAFAFNLLGYFEIRPPAVLVNKLDSASRSRGASDLFGALLMGMVFAMTSFTCTAPFVGNLLVLAAKGEWTEPIVGMMVFSGTFALPFFLLAVSPKTLGRLPKSGGWLNSVKVVMGLIEIAAALKFITNVDMVWGWNVFTRPFLLGSWILIAVALALYAMGFIRFPHDTPVTKRTPFRYGSALACLGGAIWLGWGIDGRNSLGMLESYMPAEASVEKAHGSGRELVWFENTLDSTFLAARKEKKNIVIDFTGYTCTNCRWMEKNMFTKPEIVSLLAKYVRGRIYTDGEGELYEKQQAFQEEKTGTVAMPTYAIMTPDSTIIAVHTGIEYSEAKFIEFLSKGL